MENRTNPVFHVGYVETQMQYKILLEDRHYADVRTVNVDTGICNNGLVEF
jgi:hypothetical protein